jgi:hypothetical protein
MGLFKKNKEKKFNFSGPWSYQTAGNLKLIYENTMLKMPVALEELIKKNFKDDDGSDSTIMSALILETIEKTAKVAFENGANMERSKYFNNCGPYRNAYSPMWSQVSIYKPAKGKSIDEQSEEIQDEINEQVDRLITDAELKIEEMKKRYGI